MKDCTFTAQEVRIICALSASDRVFEEATGRLPSTGGVLGIKSGTLSWTALTVNQWVDLARKLIQIDAYRNAMLASRIQSILAYAGEVSVDEFLVMVQSR